MSQIKVAKQRAQEEIESHSVVTERAQSGSYTATYKAKLRNGLQLTGRATSSDREHAVKCATKNVQTNIVNIFIYIEHEKRKIESHRFDEDDCQVVNKILLFEEECA